MFILSSRSGEPSVQAQRRLSVPAFAALAPDCGDFRGEGVAPAVQRRRSRPPPPPILVALAPILGGGGHRGDGAGARLTRPLQCLPRERHIFPRGLGRLCDRSDRPARWTRQRGSKRLDYTRRPIASARSKRIAFSRQSSASPRVQDGRDCGGSSAAAGLARGRGVLRPSRSVRAEGWNSWLCAFDRRRWPESRGPLWASSCSGLEGATRASPAVAAPGGVVVGVGVLVARGAVAPPERRV